MNIFAAAQHGRHATDRADRRLTRSAASAALSFPMATLVNHGLTARLVFRPEDADGSGGRRLP